VDAFLAPQEIRYLSAFSLIRFNTLDTGLNDYLYLEII
jgi:hypothetical protein